MAVRKISSSEVEIGMFVSNLDRPWLETSFPFQGIEVHNQHELDEILRLTKYVYILEPDENIQIDGLQSTGNNFYSDDKALHVESYSDTVTVDEEIQNIKPVHNEFVNILSNLYQLTQSNGKLNLEIIEQPMKTMVKSVIKNADAYLWLTRLKKFDSFVYKDALTASVIAASMGRTLGLPPKDILKLSAACILMDIGKLLLPEKLVHQAHRLSHEEWETMKTHVKLGVNLVNSKTNIEPEIIQVIETHHERINGGGYPLGLHGSEIPLLGQVAGIIDQYVAVTSPRPFSKPISPSHAEQMLYKQKGIHFDTMLVEYFIQALSTYPTGTLVELSTGEVAIVKSQHHSSHLKPDLILLLDKNKKSIGTYTYISLDAYIINDLPVTITRSIADGEYGIIIDNLNI